jgi:hypothetical protein
MGLVGSAAGNYSFEYITTTSQWLDKNHYHPLKQSQLNQYKILLVFPDKKSRYINVDVDYTC